MVDIVELMNEIHVALPETSKQGIKTIREVCLCCINQNEWQVLAGGHQHVHIGEWGGDYSSWGNTAEDTLRICLASIRKAHR